MRLIDADALGELVSHGVVHYEDLMAQPTVDAVPVVRCKDCKWGKEVCGNIECWTDMNLPPEYHGYYWYCPNGERKDDDTD